MQLVSYFRVSTDRQGESGLGLESQRRMVAAYAQAHGLTVIREFTEVESGKRSKKKVNLGAPIWQLIDHRPELRKAIELCQRCGHRLVIAKIDRLARDVAFTACLQGAGVDFVACDNPTASPLTIGILAVVAQEEARMISERTKAALASLKARGVLLGSARPGCWDGREHLRLAGLVKARAAAVKARSDPSQAYGPLVDVIRELRASGAGYLTIAKKLNAEGHKTVQGCAWNHSQVSRVLAMAV